MITLVTSLLGRQVTCCPTSLKLALGAWPSDKKTRGAVPRSVGKFSLSKHLTGKEMLENLSKCKFLNSSMNERKESKKGTLF